MTQGGRIRFYESKRWCCKHACHFIQYHSYCWCVWDFNLTFCLKFKGVRRLLRGQAPLLIPLKWSPVSHTSMFELQWLIEPVRSHGKWQGLPSQISNVNTITRGFYEPSNDLTWSKNSEQFTHPFVNVCSYYPIYTYLLIILFWRFGTI